MSLVYIWVEEYGSKLISEQGFNFGGELRFEYDTTERELTVEDNIEYTENFFDESGRINNVTGIVGANGAGKTTIINLIKELFYEGEIQTDKKYIIVISEEVGLKTEVKIFYHKTLLNGDIKKKTQKRNIEILPVPYSEDDDEDYKQVFVGSCVFFSNIFDQNFVHKKVPRVKSKLYDISTNHLIKSDLEQWKEELDKGFIDQVEVHRFENVRRQVTFVSSFPEEKLEFIYPHFIAIGHVNISNDGYEDSENLAENYRKKINDILQKENQKGGTDTKKELIIRVLHNMFNNFFNEFNERLQIPGEIPHLKEDDDFTIKINYLIGDLKEKFGNYYDELQRGVGDEEFEAIAESCIKKLDAMSYLFILLLSELIIEKNRILMISIANSDFIKKMLFYYFKSFSEQAYMTFNWERNISSGQKAMLDLYSRFFSIAEKVNNDEEENLMVLVDEVDLYFHPQWQKQMIKKIIDFLLKLYPKKNIQLVLSSNSPFIISDLPKSQVIFLEGENENIKVAKGLGEKEQTFAANIHTLFSDSFFLQGALIGDFAMYKINWIIDTLNGDIKGIKENERKMRKIINIVGEPLIKYKLMNMLEDKLRLFRWTGMEEEKAMLEKRLEYINSKLGESE